MVNKDVADIRAVIQQWNELWTFIQHRKISDLTVVLLFIHVLLCSPRLGLYFLESCLALQKMFYGSGLETLPLFA